jgi:hypothetical protein
MYKDVILVGCCIFLLTILIQYYDSTIKQKEEFRKKQIGKGFKKIVIRAAAACGPAAILCGGLVGNRVIAATNEQRQEDYDKRIRKEGIRRCKVLTGYEPPLTNTFSNIKIGGFNVEATPEACKEFRTFCTESTENIQAQELCNVYKTQCRLARSCSFYDSHMTEINPSK